MGICSLFIGVEMCENFLAKLAQDPKRVGPTEGLPRWQRTLEYVGPTKGLMGPNISPTQNTWKRLLLMPCVLRNP